MRIGSFENMDLEKQAIDILQTFAGNEPYRLGYSGGKDSDVILHLAKKAGVPFTAVHNLTTVDAPETVRYVRSKPEVLIPQIINVAVNCKTQDTTHKAFQVLL